MIRKASGKKVGSGSSGVVLEYPQHLPDANAT